LHEGRQASGRERGALEDATVYHKPRNCSVSDESAHVSIIYGAAYYKTNRRNVSRATHIMTCLQASDDSLDLLSGLLKGSLQRLRKALSSTKAVDGKRAACMHVTLAGWGGWRRRACAGVQGSAEQHQGTVEDKQ
jgi:hypothetical protein